jgi:hypothetical protein
VSLGGVSVELGVGRARTAAESKGSRVRRRRRPRSRRPCCRRRRPRGSDGCAGVPRGEVHRTRRKRGGRLGARAARCCPKSSTRNRHGGDGRRQASERFHRAASARRDAPLGLGLGLGLPIARTLAEANGAAITLTSRP